MDKEKDTIYKAQMVQNTDNKEANIPKSKEDENKKEYEWGQHPNSLKALKKNQFPKGVSGNVMGRKPTFDSLSKHLKELGDRDVMNWCKDKVLGTRKELVLERIWEDAMKGDMNKIRLLAWLGCLD